MQGIWDVPCFVSKGKLEKFLKTVQTPLFLYDETSFARAAQAVFSAFSPMCGFLPRFPVRMNPNPAVLRILRGAGCGALCRSLAELRLAGQCGFRGRQIAYEALRADDRAEQAAHDAGAVFVLDDPAALPARLPEAAVLLLRQQGQLRHDGKLVAGVPACYAGMERSEIFRVASSLRAHGVKWLGLGMQLGDLCMDAGFYPAIFAQLAALAQELYEKTGICVNALDLGGGFGVGYRPGFAGSEIEACAEAIRAQLLKLPEPLAGLALQMSPGRFLAASGGMLITRVRAVKPGLPPVAVLDVDPAQCLRLAKSGVYHPAAAVRESGRQLRAQLLTGCTRQGPAVQRILPELRPGDPVLIGMLGADGRSLCSGYAGAQPCPEYLYRLDGTIEPVTAC